jgi:hypothetical protein
MDRTTDELIAYLRSHKIEIYHQCARRLQDLKKDLEDSQRFIQGLPTKHLVSYTIFKNSR